MICMTRTPLRFHTESDPEKKIILAHHRTIPVLLSYIAAPMLQDHLHLSTTYQLPTLQSLIVV